MFQIFFYYYYCYRYSEARFPYPPLAHFSEVLRVIDSLQLTAEKKVATPADWQAGGNCMVLPTIPSAEAKQLFPDHKVHEVPSGKQYLRTTPCPK